MDSTWEPDRVTLLYLSGLTHLTITYAVLFVRNLDKLLRCARSPVSLIAPRSTFWEAPDPHQIKDHCQNILESVYEKR